MAVDETKRHEVYEAFKASHGTEIAAALMEMLSPAGVPELATKHDLAFMKSDLTLMRGEIDAMRGEVGARFGALEARLGERIERELRRQTTRFVALMFAGFAAFGGATGAVAALL